MSMEQKPLDEKRVTEKEETKLGESFNYEVERNRIEKRWKDRNKELEELRSNTFGVFSSYHYELSEAKQQKSRIEQWPGIHTALTSQQERILAFAKKFDDVNEERKTAIDELDKKNQEEINKRLNRI